MTTHRPTAKSIHRSLEFQKRTATLTLGLAVVSEKVICVGVVAARFRQQLRCALVARIRALSETIVVFLVTCVAITLFLRLGRTFVRARHDARLEVASTVSNGTIVAAETALARTRTVGTA